MNHINKILDLKKGGLINEDVITAINTITEMRSNQNLPKKDISVYPNTFGYAKLHDEQEQWSESMKLNKACAEAIIKAVNDNFDGTRLNPKAYDEVFDTFGTERVARVVAVQVATYKWDGRISNKSKTWAAEKNKNLDFTFLENNHEFEYGINSVHPTIVNAWAEKVIVKELEIEKNISNTVKPNVSAQHQTHLNFKNVSEIYKEAVLFQGKYDAIGIYQLKDCKDTRDIRFVPLEHLERNGEVPHREDYNLVYTRRIEDNQDFDKNKLLDDIYEEFNINHPHDFVGHSLSVSDIVVIQHNGEASAHYVDNFGFKELQNFGEIQKTPQEKLNPDRKPSILNQLNKLQQEKCNSSKTDPEKIKPSQKSSEISL